MFAGKAGIQELLNTGHPEGTHWIPAEVDVSIRPGWFYHAKEDSLVKSPEKLFDIYLTSVGRGSTLLLNIPPDKRGLVNEIDLASLQGWRKMIDSAFRVNLARSAEVIASGYRGGDASYSPENVVDADKESYWTTDDNVTTADIQLDLGEVKEIKFLLIQEYIRLGQRVKNFTVESWQNGSWQPLASATTIGYKRILKFDPVKTEKLRINITSSRACPVISNIEVY